MPGEGSRTGGLIILGVCLLTLGGLLWLWSEPPPQPQAAATIALHVATREGGALFNASELLVPAPNATAIGALWYAAGLGNFTVNVTYVHQGVPFVVDIAGVPNEGACGWVYAVNDRKPSIAADRSLLRDGDALRWFWDCTG